MSRKRKRNRSRRLHRKRRWPRRRHSPNRQPPRPRPHRDKVRVRGYVLVGGPEGASHDEVLGKPVTITVDSPGGKKHTVKGIIGFASPVIEGFGSDRQFRIWAEVDNEKSVDPITGLEHWKIQPGSMATMNIDLRPTRAVLKPVTSAEKSDSKTTKSTARER